MCVNAHIITSVLASIHIEQGQNDRILNYSLEFYNVWAQMRINRE